MKRIALVLAVLALTATAVASTAAAATTNSKLDTVASEFAGRPIHTACFTDSGDDVYGWDIEAQLWGVYGVYLPSMPDWVFISPAACQPMLTAVTSGLRDAGLRPFSNGLTTLIHESFHARGYVNEADTEACAMKYLPKGMADFGVYPTKTIAVKKARIVKHHRKVGKRMFRWNTSKVVTVYHDVVDPDYGKIIGFATQFHNALPSQYLNGTCS